MDEEILKKFEGQEVVLSHYDEQGTTRTKFGIVLKVKAGILTLQFIDDSSAVRDLSAEKIFYIARRSDGN